MSGVDNDDNAPPAAAEDFKKKGGTPRKTWWYRQTSKVCRVTKRKERANGCSELTERERQRESEEQKARTIKNGRADRESERETGVCRWA